MAQISEIRALLLAAGFGTRLKPLTDHWPKCLMPVDGRPLLEYWLYTLQQAGISNALVNLHYQAEDVCHFLDRPRYHDWVENVYEPNLLGTAGTLRANYSALRNKTVLLVHADNWCRCAFDQFIQAHLDRPDHCPITMMTFDTETPQSCGIVELDSQNVVTAFHEKVVNPPGTRANGAVYLIEPEVVDWLMNHPDISDFSTEVLPNYIGRIATWHNHGIHRDIGTIESLQKAQLDDAPSELMPMDAWQRSFNRHSIHQAIVDGSWSGVLEKAS